MGVRPNVQYYMSAHLFYNNKGKGAKRHGSEKRCTDRLWHRTRKRCRFLSQQIRHCVSFRRQLSPEHTGVERRCNRRGVREELAKLVKIDIGWCKDRLARVCTRAANIVMLRNYADLRRGTPAN